MMGRQAKRHHPPVLRPARVWPLGFTDATPADRRQLAGLVGALALLVAGAARNAYLLELTPLPVLPEAPVPPIPLPAGLELPAHLLAIPLVLGAVAIAAIAVLRWVRASRPVYPGPADLLLDAWEIVPGERIGPLSLGPLGTEAIQLLREYAGFVYTKSDRVTCVLLHWQGETIITATTDQPPPDEEPPDPARFAEICEVSTTSPIHLGPGGLHVGMPMPDAAAAVGLPDAFDPPPEIVAPRRSLQYRQGLRLSVQRNEVRWITISEAVEGGTP